MDLYEVALGEILDTGNSRSPWLLVVLGPTASGKSSLAVALALRLAGEIINCDAMQMIRYLNIGTAKPTLQDRELVPHHLFDVIDPDEFYSAGAYMKDARKVCREVAKRAKVPIVVGGTGLYLQVFLEGIFEGPEKSDEVRGRLQRIAESKGSSYCTKYSDERIRKRQRRFRKVI
jgi:tRNA dimethylallyltransferase